MYVNLDTKCMLLCLTLTKIGWCRQNFH